MDDGYGKKAYFDFYNIHDVRKFFRTRVFLQPFANNFKNDKNTYKNGLCRCGLEIEAQSHLVTGKCPIFGDLVPDHFNIQSDQHLVNLFTNILNRRDVMDEIEKSNS